jgi:tRNA-Thr(GGU) m(6)t(6)A37 methyltransferase TsaA
MEISQMWLRPVGAVRSKIKEQSLAASLDDLEWKGKLEEAKEEKSGTSELIIDPDLTGILDGIEEFSHLIVIYWAHSVPPEARSFTKVHPMGRKDLPLKGIFATCSPARPNPICVTTVRLLERKANVLKVEGLDAVDGSPLIDIKPYIPSYYAAGEVKIADWMMQIEREIAGASSE